MGSRREKELRRRENDRTETETETLRASPVAILRSTHDFSAVFFQQSGDAEVVSLATHTQLQLEQTGATIHARGAKSKPLLGCAINR
jgi:CHAT domain-containing protein